MPELPEVETIRRGLDPIIIGSKILSVSSSWPKSFPNAASEVKRFLYGSHITAIRRRGKVLIIDLNTGYSLLIHLKMTGQLVYRALDGSERFAAGHPTKSLVGNLPDASTRVVIRLEKGTIYFNDQRKFGWVRLFPTNRINDIDFFAKLGPEPLESNFTATDFVKRLRRRNNTNVKAALLDQTVVAGVGNIYADEALYGARLHPSTIVGSISDATLADLLASLRSVMELSIQKGGSTDKTYVDASGKKGSYLSFAKVFRREGKTCMACGNSIEKIRVAGRGTHVCPVCQPEISKK